MENKGPGKENYSPNGEGRKPSSGLRLNATNTLNTVTSELISQMGLLERSIPYDSNDAERHKVEPYTVYEEKEEGSPRHDDGSHNHKQRQITRHPIAKIKAEKTSYDGLRNSLSVVRGSGRQGYVVELLSEDGATAHRYIIQISKSEIYLSPQEIETPILLKIDKSQNPPGIALVIKNKEIAISTGGEISVREEGKEVTDTLAPETVPDLLRVVTLAIQRLTARFRPVLINLEQQKSQEEVSRLIEGISLL